MPADCALRCWRIMLSLRPIRPHCAAWWRTSRNAFRSAWLVASWPKQCRNCSKHDGKFGGPGAGQVLELLDWVDEIAVVPPSRDLTSASVPTSRSIIRFTDRWMGHDHNHLSAYDASEGALYVLFALVLALHPKSPRLFAIENLDQNMHPRLARATVRLFCELLRRKQTQRQALLTTHNPLVLDGLDLRDDRIRLFTVGRNAKGATRIDRVQVGPEMLKAIDGGLALSNLWIMGRLGGVPDLF